MGTIPSELLKFKNNVEGKLSSIGAIKENLSSDLTNYINYSDTFKSGIDSYYNSQNKESLITKITEVSKSSVDIKTSLDSFLGVIVSKSENLIGLVKELEKINNDISSLNKEDEKYEENLSSLNSQFSEKEKEANKLLSDMKAMEHGLKVPEKPTEIVLDTPTGGKISKYVYKAPNGSRMTYYMYVPEGIDSTKKLPMHVYLHGSGERGEGALNQSLPKLINNGYKPAGIVLIPQLPLNKSYSNQWSQQMVMGTINEVIKTQNVDTNRISLSGHSDGAIGGYALVQAYPNTFSAFVPISGRSSIKVNPEELRRLKIFAFHGTSDSSVEYNKGAEIIRYIRSLGNNNSYLHAFQNAGHGIQNQVFTNQFSFNGKEMLNPLDWAFMQTKA